MASTSCDLRLTPAALGKRGQTLSGKSSKRSAPFFYGPILGTLLAIATLLPAMAQAADPATSGFQPATVVYKNARVTLAPGQVVEKTHLLLKNGRIAAIGPDVPIADAVRRDRALDAFQAMLDERARATEQRNSAQVQQIAQEVEELLKRKQAEMDALRSEISEVKRQSLEFAGRRETEERRLAALISPFLEGQPNPVTVGSAAVEAKETQPLPSGKTTTRA